MNETAKYLVTTNPGDCVSSLSGIRNHWKETGKKALIYQRLGMRTDYYVNATHPTKNEKGEMVCCNKEMFEMLRPLIVSQEYIEDYVVWQGESVDFDLGKVRHEVYVNLPFGAIQNWDGLYYSELQGDISEQWVDVPREISWTKGKVILNFTERYNNPYMSYFFLKEYEEDLVFSGTYNECKIFTERWGLNIHKCEWGDFLDLAIGIAGCKFLLSNQSLHWNIAQATHSPRLLELCGQFPNCIHGIGKNSHGYYNQNGLEALFKKLYNR